MNNPEGTDRKTTLPGSSPIRIDRPVPDVPDHTLLRCIGRGSYGEVWLARNVLGTHRAVKIVYRASFQNEKPYEREFSGMQKFEPLSRSHEGLVDVLQIGRNDQAGYFYYIMELADDDNAGPTFPGDQSRPGSSTTGKAGGDGPRKISERVAVNTDRYKPRTLKSELEHRGRLSFEECLKIGLSLSSALGFLHQNSLIHRDIKPSNIIFVHGLAKLADIGLVADASDAKSFVGTEGFIPPEGPGTVQADIYSLGKVFYEVSTGMDRHEFPELPAELMASEEAGQIVELNETVLKACEPDPKRRYASAEKLHADLEWLQSGKSIKLLRQIDRRMSRLKRTFDAALFFALVIAAGFGIYAVLHFGDFEKPKSGTKRNLAVALRPENLAGRTSNSNPPADAAALSVFTNALGSVESSVATPTPVATQTIAHAATSSSPKFGDVRESVAVPVVPAPERVAAVWDGLVRLGTLVPDGSSYCDALREMDQTWQRTAGRRVKLTVFPDARFGSEAEMIRRIGSGKIDPLSEDPSEHVVLHAALVSTIGLAEIDASVRALQTIPMLYRSWEEVDFVRHRLQAGLEEKFRRQGFVVLFWADAGWVRFFSKTGAIHPDDFKALRIFAWKGDEIQISIMKKFGYKPFEYEPWRIMDGLSANKIDVVPVTPFYALAKQFAEQAPHLLDVKWSPIVGAAVMRKDTWDNMPRAAQEALRKAAEIAGEKIRRAGRVEDSGAIEAMVGKQRLQVHRVTAEIENEWRHLAEATYAEVRGRIIPPEIFDQATNLVHEYRALKK